jgi:tRNA-dihydrouridine synthase
MVGLSHVVLRLIVRQYLPPGQIALWPTEMLNSRRLPNEDLSKTPETLRSECEEGLVPQILGNEPEPIRKSVRILKDWGAVAIDINMGCPVKKALKHNYGVALMGDAKYAAEVVRMAVESSDLPVSVKLRAGEESEPEKLFDFVAGLEEAGASWITLHPRFAHQMRRGSADWEKIAEVRSRLSIPVIGNGDVQTAEDVFALFQAGECDRVMVGRALTARPWMLWQVGERLGLPPPLGRSGPAPQSPEEEGYEFYRVLHQMVDGFEKYFSTDLGLRKARFYIKNAAPWLEFGHDLESRFCKSRSFDELRSQMDQFYRVPQRMMARTQLRY